ncbi:DNA-binding protein [Leptospira sp. 201903071]|uniref:LA_0442/LA_0875 N-terminal domain-containing protein n=1 Tax=Leptospira ainazelensis TaxID=2810034 RepID=UPI001966A2BD|nr:DNA-binding protein [Leptospira ainazelensis]MBM9502422.1 DNA-binding protein [Leptospira ainazelensis]
MRIFTRFCPLLILCCFWSLDLNAKSVLLKNGRKIENVKIKPVSNGFEITHTNGRIENIPLSKILKIFVSDDVPKSAQILGNSDSQTKNKKSQEQTKANEVFLEVVESKAKKTSGLKSFSEGLIPGWSRLVRSDSYAWKGLGFFFILTELILLERSSVYLQEPGFVSDDPNYGFPPEFIYAVWLRDTNLILLTGINEAISTYNKVRLSDGQMMEKSRYLQERDLVVSGLLLVLLLDAYLGYKYEDWKIVPSVNVSFSGREKEISGGLTVRF